MKFVIFVVCSLLALPAFTQSKKELKDRNQKLEARSQRLEAEVKRLEARVDSLRKGQDVAVGSRPERASYSIGVMIGSNIASQAMDSLDVNNVMAGMRDVMENRTLKIDQNEAQMIVQQYMENAMERKTQKAKEEGTSFLEQNKTQPGVQTTPSGLQCKIVTEGTGKKPGPTSSVTVHYTGKLVDGTIFDSSVQRGQPATFPLNQVIKGWTEGLQLLKEGGKAILYIPYDLGYGERGAGGQIPPFSTLIFEVELLKVN